VRGLIGRHHLEYLFLYLVSGLQGKITHVTLPLYRLEQGHTSVGVGSGCNVGTGWTGPEKLLGTRNLREDRNLANSLLQSWAMSWQIGDMPR
jgi:hypothetical protein